MKKQPIRMCLGCMKRGAKNEFVRIVKHGDNSVAIDESGKIDCRGAYICRKYECVVRARKARRLERIFKKRIPDDLYSKLEDMYKHE